MGSSELSVDPKSQALFSILRRARCVPTGKRGWIGGKNRGFPDLITGRYSRLAILGLRHRAARSRRETAWSGLCSNLKVLQGTVCAAVAR